MRSYHDDLVMALAIGCWVRDTALTVNQRDMDYRKAMIGSIQTSRKLSTQQFRAWKVIVKTLTVTR